jgi:hypothetical protein
MVPDLSEREKRLLEVLVHLADRILHSEQDDNHIDSGCLSAGEGAILALAEYGLATCEPPWLRIGEWTDAGLEFRKKLPGYYAEEVLQYGLEPPSASHEPECTHSIALGMSDREAQLLEAVYEMAGQFYVGERTIAVLAEYGLVEPMNPGNSSAISTATGQKFYLKSLRHL